MTKAMKETASLAEKFDSMAGLAVEVSCGGDFPIPQDDGYSMFNSFPFCMVYKKDWRSKISFMQSVEYHAACKDVPKLGWATKENCRRPARHHPADVVSELVWCFDATPRLNNYEIHKHLEQKFEIGTKVLRVSQIAGWITSEIKRRKEASLKAAATAARYLEQAVSSDGVIDSAQLETEEQQVEGVFKSCMIEFDFTSAVAMGMNPDVNLVKWKHKILATKDTKPSGAQGAT